MAQCRVAEGGGYPHQTARTHDERRGLIRTNVFTHPAAATSISCKQEVCSVWVWGRGRIKKRPPGRMQMMDVSSSRTEHRSLRLRWVPKERQSLSHPHMMRGTTTDGRREEAYRYPHAQRSCCPSPLHRTPLSHHCCTRTKSSTSAKNTAQAHFSGKVYSTAWGGQETTPPPLWSLATGAKAVLSNRGSDDGCTRHAPHKMTS